MAPDSLRSRRGDKDRGPRRRGPAASTRRGPGDHLSCRTWSALTVKCAVSYFPAAPHPGVGGGPARCGRLPACTLPGRLWWPRSLPSPSRQNGGRRRASVVLRCAAQDQTGCLMPQGTEDL